MLKLTKSYIAFSGWLYRLAVCIGIPVVMIGIHGVLVSRFGLDISTLLLFSMGTLEVILDNWFLGGIQSKECEKLDYLKTSGAGKALFRNTLIADVLRKFLTFVLVGIAMYGICEYFLPIAENEQIVPALEQQKYFICMMIGSFALMQVGIFITRFFTYVIVSIGIEYALTGIGSVALMLTILCLGTTTGMLIFGGIAILFAILPVVVATKKMEGSYYDG